MWKSRLLGNGMRLDKGRIEVIDDVMAGILRNKTPAERIHIGFEMWLSAQKMLFSHLSTTYPHWSNEQLNREVAADCRMGPYELLQKVITASEELGVYVT
jgi:hypothetical protein